MSDSSQVGSYRILRRIGAGGMGVVYEGMGGDPPRRVAIKLLNDMFRDDAEQRSRVVSEAELAARIDHRNVVRIFELGEDAGRRFIVMEFLDGEGLDAVLGRETLIRHDQTLRLMFPVFSAICAAHRVGVIHRDLKPANIFLARGPDGRAEPKLLDFGMSRAIGRPQAHSFKNVGSVIGTPGYLAPEMLFRGNRGSERSDLYALGAILYECVTGRRPFESDSLAATLAAVSEFQLDAPHGLQPEVPLAFSDIIMRSMRPDPSQRFLSVHQFAEQLLPFASADVRAVWSSEFDHGTGAVDDDDALEPTDAAPRSAALADFIKRMGQ